MTGAVLAGGQSRRMGTNKALLKIDGTTIIERVTGILTPIFDTVVIIANDPAPYSFLELKTYPDIHIGAGSLGGLHTAIVKSRSDYTFVTACDMPFLDTDCIKRLLSATTADFDAIIPFIGGRAHPMHGIYSKRCAGTIEAMIKCGNLRINSLLEQIPVKRLTEADFDGLPIETSVENINSEEDLKRHGYAVDR
ncbi:MAG: molybdenum cofactor guanylyltransferase [Deltaproteobacteria bacterium]